MTNLADNLKPSEPPAGPARLIVFTRYPEPGRAKTRLIPALGVEGAARLQEQMARFTLARMAPLAGRGVGVEVRYAGGDEAAMRALYGPAWAYRPQGGGDLGERMSRAVRAAPDEGCAAVALIGTDCPDLGPAQVRRALAMLAENDVALGPAADGGYYLIALRRHVPELFEGIDWGTATVLAGTRAVAEHLGLRVGLLEELRDVDVPEDLAVWEAALRRHHAT